MNTTTIPSAEDYLKEQLVEKLQSDFVSKEKCKESFVDHLEIWWGTDAVKAVEEIINEYAVIKAKMYVKAALQKASEEAKIIAQHHWMPGNHITDSISTGENESARVYKDSIINAYPEHLIK